MTDLLIGGLPLPPALIALIRAGRWVPPPCERVYLDVFGAEPDHPYFYDLPDMKRQNEFWQRSGTEDVYGSPVEGRSVGIEPSLSIVIGDLGPDMPIALDYRATSTVPRVLHLRFSGSPEWVHIASSVEELISRLYGDDP
ncbi:SMI1/KNR4 family protein [Nonomuraea sp. NPDC050547]|uniref:SMI1/KNR4 family protein n=1 Tax=Nonomuraea sp. NPDC050547 TaxID=3364368 RepID=UPI0037B72BAD